MRVLALAWRKVPQATPHEQLEDELVLAGLVGLADPPRPEVPAATASCRTAGIRVIMVTGDHPQTARAVARQVGLARKPPVITGAQLAHLSDTQLQLALDRPPSPAQAADEIVFARVTADQKMRVVDALKRKGDIVAATDRRSAFAFGMASNPLLLWGIAVEIVLILAIVYTPIGQTLFGTAPLPAAAWLFVLPFAVAMAALEEGRKAIARRIVSRNAVACTGQLR
ncbi:MAG TPA: cation transporting ATPase C-terminal domain-containing protein [Burkholderiaceae bacterium]|nr:cation transporting ATPase C-terminal domain-containing protein [Burkholderiaceae bacterium]